uniref:Uncharacterized protein n=1 Tax=Anguilla anguilla TaxID=7936 RepID=A0A0E9X8K2_ANGAN
MCYTDLSDSCSLSSVHQMQLCAK